MVTVGIDPHKQVHIACAVNAQGRVVSRALRVEHSDRDALVKLVSWAREVSGDAPVRFAIEDGRGLARRLADGLLLAGEHVVWVPVRLAVAHRRLHAASGAKSDALDAAGVARAAMASPELDGHRIDERVRALRLLVDARTDVVTRRTQVINQIKAYAQMWLAEQPGNLCTQRGRAQLDQAIHTAHLGEQARQVLADMGAEIATLSTRIRDLERRIHAQVEPLAPTLLQITGIGPVAAATLIAEIGDITRFPTAAKLARYAGCAPIPVYSSDQQRHRLHRGGNRRINSVLYYTALVQTRFSDQARQLLARHTPTKGGKGARRILKRHLIDVIYRAMVTDRTGWDHHITHPQPHPLT